MRGKLSCFRAATSYLRSHVLCGIAGTYHYYLHADYSVRCSHGSYRDEVYDSSTTVAHVLILLWPIGVPALFAALLFACRHELRRESTATALSRAVKFITREYRALTCYW